MSNANVEFYPPIGFGKRDQQEAHSKSSSPEAERLKHASAAARIRNAIDGVAGSLHGSFWRIDLMIKDLETAGGDPAQVAEFRKALEVIAATSATLVTIVGHNNSLTLDRASKGRGDDL